MEIRVQVKPGTSKGDKIEALPDGSYIVWLKAKPIDGKANQALVKLLAEHFDIGKANIQIKRGAGSHYKTIVINK